MTRNLVLAICVIAVALNACSSENGKGNGQDGLNQAADLGQGAGDPPPADEEAEAAGGASITVAQETDFGQGQPNFPPKTTTLGQLTLGLKPGGCVGDACGFLLFVQNESGPPVSAAELTGTFDVNLSPSDDPDAGVGPWSVQIIPEASTDPGSCSVGTADFSCSFQALDAGDIVQMSASAPVSTGLSGTVSITAHLVSAE